VNPTLRFVLGVGGLFALIGAAMAFLIIYREYARHRLDSGKLFREAALGAITAFLVILGLSTLAAYLLSMVAR